MDFSFIDKNDRRTDIVDGKATELINANGLLQLAFHGMIYNKLPKCKNAIIRYCQYISLHGYSGGAKKAYHSLAALGYNDGVRWLKDTHKKYVTDDVSMMSYVLESNIEITT